MTDDRGGENAGAEQLIKRPKLRVWAIVREAYAIWFANLGLWLKLSIVPIVLLIVLRIVAATVLPEVEQSNTQPPSLFAAIFLFLCGVFVYLSEIPLATAWHRLILTCEDTESHRYLLGNREWHYFLVAIFIIAITVLISMAMSAVIVVVFNLFKSIAIEAGPASSGFMVLDFLLFGFLIGTFVLIAYVIGYLFLMLPAAATGRKLAAREAKTAVISNRWRLIGVYIITLFPISLVSMLLSWPYAGKGTATASSSDLLNHAPAIIFAPAVIGVVSIAYRDLIQKPEAAAGGTDEALASSE